MVSPAPDCVLRDPLSREPCSNFSRQDYMINKTILLIVLILSD